MDAGNENHRKDQSGLDEQQQFLPEKEAGRMERRRGEEEEMEIEMEESSANRKRWGWLDEKRDACVSKCTQQVGQTNLICDEQAVQPPVAIARYLAALLYAHDTYRSPISSS